MCIFDIVFRISLAMALAMIFVLFRTYNKGDTVILGIFDYATGSLERRQFVRK